MSHDDLRAEYERLKEQVAQLLQQKPPLESESTEARELLQRLQAVTQEYDQKLSDAEAQIAELKRELFGPKADKLTPEQEDQLKKLNKDLQDEAQRPAPVSDQVLEREDRASRRRGQRRRGRHPLPDHLETETVTIEPEEKVCPIEEHHRCVAQRLVHTRTDEPWIESAVSFHHACT